MGIVRMQNANAGKGIPVEERFDRSSRAQIGGSNDRPNPKKDGEVANTVAAVLTRFIHWLDSYGETSWGHQRFFAGPVGGKGQTLFYLHGLFGTAPCVPRALCER